MKNINQNYDYSGREFALKPTTVESLLDNQVYSSPNHIAFQRKNEKITFSDLHRYSDNVKNFLIDIGIKPFKPIVVIGDRSIEVIISIYAILKIGAFFVPVNPKEGKLRLLKILKDCSPSCIISTENNLDIVVDFADNICIEKVVVTKADTSSAIINNVTLHKCSYITPYISEEISYFKKMHTCESIAYMIYTSGSSGEPKGVMIKHRSLMNFITETIAILGFNRCTRILSTKPFYFDAIMTDLFCIPFGGGTVILLGDDECNLPRKLVAQIQNERATHLSIAPGIVKLLAKMRAFSKGCFDYIKTFSFGADVVPSSIILQLMEDLPHVKFYNRYGPTECTVVCSTYKIDSLKRGERIPIGKPANNTKFYILDENKNLLEQGKQGELYVGGYQVMSGYWGDDCLTSEVLFSNIVPGEILYKTGDLVMKNDNGDYVFIGRLDFTINKNGYRINLTELEVAFRELHLVEDCVCTVANHESEVILCAFVTTTELCESHEIRNELRYQLAEYMIPDKIIVLKSIPITDTGKPDRNMLLNTLV